MNSIGANVEALAEALDLALDEIADLSLSGDYLKLVARRLADSGFVAPAPLREEWGVDCYLGFEPEAYSERRNAEKHLAYEGGSLLRRHVSDWRPAGNDEGCD